MRSRVLVHICAIGCRGSDIILEIQSPRNEAFKRTWQCPTPRRNRVLQSSDRVKYCTRVRPERERNGQANDQPDDPPDIKLDIEYMADVAVLEFGGEPARVEVPDLHGSVITCADESTSDRVERKSTNE